MVIESSDSLWSESKKKDSSPSLESLSPPPPSTRKSIRLMSLSKKAALSQSASKKRNVRTSPPISASLSLFFKTPSHAKLWSSVSKRNLVSERTLHHNDFAKSGFEELLGETNLLGSVRSCLCS